VSIAVQLIKLRYGNEIKQEAINFIKTIETTAPRATITDIANAVFNIGGWGGEDSMGFEKEKRQAIYEVIKEDVFGIKSKKVLSDDEIEMR
jgi:hypothetical protein